MKHLRNLVILILLLLAGPFSLVACGEVSVEGDWSEASRDAAGIAPDPASHPEAIIQVYAARAFKWRGAFAVHTWIAVKPARASVYTTYEVMGWNLYHGDSAINVNDGAPDRYWYGARPRILAELRGEAAEAAIVRIRRAVAEYPHAGEYQTWPGPNSNTFTAFILRRVPELKADLPPTAIGKDYIPGPSFVARTPSGGGLQLSAFGLLGILVSVEEGVEFNLFGLSAGF
ncbi:MAG: DUF3750 domain-containing protein, partial [Alphaproteobacteria bacterium]|nr:DUF3750 domain-containing protein [Alphaproteobacteria bacterium]